MGWVEYPNFNTRTARLWAPVNLFFCGMLFTGMASMQHNSVPMVTVFKNITNIMTTIGDCILYGASIELLVMAAFGIMLLGAIFAARNDADVTQTGLCWMLANCLCTSGYVSNMLPRRSSFRNSEWCFTTMYCARVFYCP
jgi:GDP-mannose transporter